MLIKVNGNSEEVSRCTIAQLIGQKGLDTESLVVEHNFRILNRDEWENVFLTEEDNLELLTFVGGG